MNERPGSGVRIANVNVPNAMRESVRMAEQNLYAQSRQLVGDRNPEHHELMVQLRAFDASRIGANLGIPTLLALASALIGKSFQSGLVTVGQINLGGAIDPIINAVSIAELAVEKGASTLLLPVSSRKQLIDLPDDMAPKLDTRFYTDARDSLFKSLAA